MAVSRAENSERNLRFFVVICAAKKKGKSPLSLASFFLFSSISQSPFTHPPPLLQYPLSPTTPVIPSVSLPSQSIPSPSLPDHLHPLLSFARSFLLPATHPHTSAQSAQQQRQQFDKHDSPSQVSRNLGTQDRQAPSLALTLNRLSFLAHPRATKNTPGESTSKNCPG